MAKRIMALILALQAVISGGEDSNFKVDPMCICTASLEVNADYLMLEIEEDEVSNENIQEDATEDVEIEETLVETTEETKVESITAQTQAEKYKEWHTGKLTAKKGFITDGPAGPNGNDGYETWYDLDMTRVVEIMDELMQQKSKEDGWIYDYEYWVREDGCKMYGPYIMVAGDIVNTRKRGDIIEISLGTAMVCDYCEYAVKWRPNQIDVATDWEHTYSKRD